MAIVKIKNYNISVMKRLILMTFSPIFYFKIQDGSSSHLEQESLPLASMARDDPPTSSTAPASSTAAAMRGKVESEFET